MNQPSSHAEFHQTRGEFARLWADAEKRVLAYVLSMIPSFHDAEDVVQQVAVEAAAGFDEQRPGDAFVGWVIGRAKYRILDHFRKAGRDRLVFDDRLVDTLTDAHLVASPLPHREAALEHCLQELPLRSRRLIDLRYVDGKEPTEIAQEISSTAGSVRVTLLRLRNALAECITRRERLLEGAKP